MSKEDNKRMAKNTVFLYIRMLLIMFVSLYTYRVVLRILGEDDYGIYQTVGGVVVILTFVSNALGAGTSRFLTYEMGKEKPQLAKLFSTVKKAHTALAGVIVVIGEIVGLVMIYTVLLIPDERRIAAVIAFQFSLVTTFFQITQAPYNALIIAYEKMDIYAYVTVLDTFLKLGIVYVLNVIVFDRLAVYAILYCCVTVTVMIVYRTYCRFKYDEVSSKEKFDKQMFREVASFSSWNLLSSSAASFANQGVTVVTNMFFAPAVVTLRSLALTINSTINTFINSFRTAINPQIVKRYAAKDYDDAKILALSTTKYTYCLTLLIVLPLFLLIEPVLKLWLGDIPIGLEEFAKISIIQGLFQAIDVSLYTPIYASGRIRENAILSPLVDFIQLPLIFVLFKIGFPPVTLAWVELCACVLLGLLIKPLVVHFVVHYSWAEIYGTLMRCLFITVSACILPVIIREIVNVGTFLGFICVGFVSVFSVLVASWFLAINKDERKGLIRWLSLKMNHNCIKDKI